MHMGSSEAGSHAHTRMLVRAPVSASPDVFSTHCMFHMSKQIYAEHVRHNNCEQQLEAECVRKRQGTGVGEEHMAWRGKRLLYNLPKPAIIECEVKKKANIRGQLCCHVSVGSYTIMKGDMPMIHACHACACGKKASAATYAAVRASTEITTWADLVIPILQAITCHMSLPGLHRLYCAKPWLQLLAAYAAARGLVRSRRHSAGFEHRKPVSCICKILLRK